MATYTPMIQLHSGPCHGAQIEDSGASCIRMALYEPGGGGMAISIGEARYEPTEDRAVAHWIENRWDERVFSAF